MAVPRTPSKTAFQTKRTAAEALWLEHVAATVCKGLLKDFKGQITESKHTRLDTDESSGGWCVAIALRDTDQELCVFIDNSLGEDRRAFWYGLSSESRTIIKEIASKARGRWRVFPTFRRDPNLAKLTFVDPFLQHYHEDEHYFGLIEEAEPDITKPLPSVQLRRVIERFSSLLAQLSADTPTGDVRLDDLEQLDGVQMATKRLEQKIIRDLLLKGRPTAACALCEKQFDATLLVAAHIKRRADSTIDERKAVKANVMLLCALGCDALFERGFVHVNEKGRIAAGPKKSRTSASAAQIKQIVGSDERQCSSWNKESSAKRTGSDMPSV